MENEINEETKFQYYDKVIDDLRREVKHFVFITTKEDGRLGRGQDNLHSRLSKLEKQTYFMHFVFLYSMIFLLVVYILFHLNK